MSFYINGVTCGIAFEDFAVSTSLSPAFTLQTCSGILNLGLDPNFPLKHLPFGYSPLPLSSNANLQHVLHQRIPSENKEENVAGRNWNQIQNEKMKSGSEGKEWKRDASESGSEKWPSSSSSTSSARALLQVCQSCLCLLRA